MSEEPNMPQDKKVEDQDKVKEESETQSQPQPEPQFQPQTTNMEVHKHPHNVTHKKNLGEYLLEFFMIFLAVFLGFLAENRRETIVEKKREREYVQSLIEDVQLDMRDLDSSIIYNAGVMKRIDSLFEIFKSGNWRNQTSDIYFIVRRSTRTNTFYYHDRTIQQMKNSGSLRLIHNIDVSNEIINYDAEVKKLIGLIERLNESRGKVRDKATMIFDPLIFYEMVKETNDDIMISKPAGNPPIKKPELLEEALCELQYLRNLCIAANNFNRE